DAAVSELLAELVSPDRVGPVLRLAQGNPFVALELARSADRPRIPDSLAESVRSRLLEGGPDVTAVVEVLAAADSELDDQVLNQVVQFSDERLDVALRRGLMVGLID